MVALHRETDALLQKEVIAMAMTYLEAPNIHSFLLLFRNPSMLIHLQGYPDLSTPDYAVVTGRLMHTDKWLQIRQTNQVLIGNEDTAVVSDIPFSFALQNPNYNSGELVKVIKAGLEAREILIR